MSTHYVGSCAVVKFTERDCRQPSAQMQDALEIFLFPNFELNRFSSGAAKGQNATLLGVRYGANTTMDKDWKRQAHTDGCLHKMLGKSRLLLRNQLSIATEQLYRLGALHRNF